MLTSKYKISAENAELYDIDENKEYTYGPITMILNGDIVTVNVDEKGLKKYKKEETARAFEYVKKCAEKYEFPFLKESEPIFEELNEDEVDKLITGNEAYGHYLMYDYLNREDKFDFSIRKHLGLSKLFEASKENCKDKIIKDTEAKINSSKKIEDHKMVDPKEDFRAYIDDCYENDVYGACFGDEDGEIYFFYFDGFNFIADGCLHKNQLISGEHIYDIITEESHTVLDDAINSYVSTMGKIKVINKAPSVKELCEAL